MLKSIKSFAETKNGAYICSVDINKQKNKIMFTFTQIIAAAQEKGFRFEFTTNRFNRWGDMGDMRTTLSVNTADAVWVTWEAFGEETEEEQYLFWMGRYNQNNGACQKTYKKENSAFYTLGLQNWK